MLIVVDAPDFTVPNLEEHLQVPIYEDSCRAIFALIPRQENERSRVIVRLYQGEALIESLTLIVAIKAEDISFGKLVWRMVSSSLSFSRTQASPAGAGLTQVNNYLFHSTTNNYGDDISIRDIIDSAGTAIGKLAHAEVRPEDKG